MTSWWVYVHVWAQVPLSLEEWLYPLQLEL